MPTVPTFRGERGLVRALPAGPGGRVFSTRGELGGRETAAAFAAARGLVAQDEAMIRAEQARARRIAITQADIKLRGLANELQFKMRELKGRQAVEADLTGDFAKQFDETFLEIDNEIEDPQTRDAVRLMGAQARQRILFAARRHQEEQSEVFERETVDSHVKTAIEDAITNFDDPETVDDAILSGMTTIQEFGIAEGKPAEMIELEANKFRSKVHVEILNRFLNNGRDLDAKNYFEIHKAELLGKDASAVEKMLQGQTELIEAQRIVDQLEAQEDMTLNKGIKIIQETTEGSLEETAKRMFKVRVSDRLAGQRQEKEKLLNDIYRRLEATRDLNAIEPSELFDPRITTQERMAILDFVSARASRRPIETDPEVFNRFHELAATPEGRKQLIELNPVNFRSKLSNTDFKEIVRLRAKIMQQGDEAELFIKEVTVSENRMDFWLRKVGKDPNTRNRTEKERISQFKNRIRDAFIEFQRKNKNVPDAVEKDKIIEDILSQTFEVGRGFFGGAGEERRMAFLLPDEVGRTRIPLDDDDNFPQEDLRFWIEQLTIMQNQRQLQKPFVPRDEFNEIDFTNAEFRNRLERLQAARIMGDAERIARILAETPE